MLEQLDNKGGELRLRKDQVHGGSSRVGWRVEDLVPLMQSMEERKRANESEHLNQPIVTL